MKHQTTECPSDLCIREAHPAFAQNSRWQPESREPGLKRGFKEDKEMSLKTMKRAGNCLFGMLLLSLAVPAFGQDEPNAVPTAPKRSYIPASVYAQPDLECKLYPAGSSSSQGLTVFTDDDGYARFYAVRAADSDATQQLALDCTDDTETSHSYSVDLTSDDTFASRPLNIAAERGVDRPALAGDPLSYTQAQLIQGHYGPRPDPTDPTYAVWLAAASKPARMLASKRHGPAQLERRMPAATQPASASQADASTGAVVDANQVVRPEVVVQSTIPWWVGATLSGAPKYAGSSAVFKVPTAISGGDETIGGTQMAIWIGVNGDGLIQGGVGMTTSVWGLAANYWIFREYCCGDGDSNGYSGAFTPNAGDSILTFEYYCDSQGNVNVAGGYGCTFIQDVTRGLVLDCTVADGSPCWSVKALPAWTSLGTDADFIMEDQTPQLYSGWNPTTHYTPGQIAVDKTYPYVCLVANTNQEPVNHTTSWALYPSLNAFTDFAPQVTMTGNAYSTKTGQYSQTVNNDPVVTVVDDSSNSTSHVSVSLGNAGQIDFTSSQFKEVAGLANTGTRAESIAVGPNPIGSTVGDPWVLGNTANSTGDYSIYHWENSSFVQKTGSATHIAISFDGHPWVVTNSGAIYYWNGSTFKAAPGNPPCAKWISVGLNAYGSSYGDPWILGCVKGPNGYNIYQLQGSSWVQQPGQAIKMAIGPSGPWITDINGIVNYWNGTGFVKAPGSPCATNIAVSPIIIPFGNPLGDAWITDCSFQSTGYNIDQLQPNNTWAQIPGQADYIAISPDLGVPWIVDSAGHIYE
jgi:hypothetical protein